MHLNRDQAMAINAVKSAGYNPVQALVLTGRHRDWNSGIVSVTAIKDGERFNLRVMVDSRDNQAKVIDLDKLITIIDKDKSTDVTTIDGCVVKSIKRRHVSIN